MTMEMDKVERVKMTARPEHLQRAAETKWLDSKGKLSARLLKSSADDTRE
jgi:hypothetical protein